MRKENNICDSKMEREEMNNILKEKLEKLKINQDKYLDNKEKAYEKRKYSSGNDSDDALLDRQMAYREGYERGWHEALEEQYRIDNNFILNETEAFKLMLEGSKIIDEYGCIYLLNREKNQIEITCKHNAIISYEIFLGYQGSKFKKHTVHVTKHKYEQNISDIQMNRVFLLPFINDCVDKIIKDTDDNKTYKFGIIIEEVF